MKYVPAFKSSNFYEAKDVNVDVYASIYTDCSNVLNNEKFGIVGNSSAYSKNKSLLKKLGVHHIDLEGNNEYLPDEEDSKLIFKKVSIYRDLMNLVEDKFNNIWQGIFEEYGDEIESNESIKNAYAEIYNSEKKRLSDINNYVFDNEGLARDVYNYKRNNSDLNKVFSRYTAQGVWLIIGTNKVFTDDISSLSGFSSSRVDVLYNGGIENEKYIKNIATTISYNIKGAINKCINRAIKPKN